jgi:hypothetical protein
LIRLRKGAWALVEKNPGQSEYYQHELGGMEDIAGVRGGRAGDSYSDRKGKA